MTTQRLSITKSMQMIHGKLRPIADVRAHVDARAAAFLLEHFSNETLFKRTAYANGFTDGGLQASPPLARMLANFIKNDACPEITVKTLLAGQKYEGAGMWDIQCFEFVAKRAFDGLAELAEGVSGFMAPELYHGFGTTPAVAAFHTDTVLEMAAAPAAVAVGGIQGMADAA